MEPAATSAVVQPPPVQPDRLHGQAHCRGGWRSWARCALIRVLFLAVTGCFAAAAYGARHRPRDLAYAVIVYFLLVLLVCCIVKLEQLRRDPASSAAVAAERRRTRVAVWVISVALVNTSASRVADAMPEVALKLAVWAVAAVVLGIAFYYLFCSKGADCCNAEQGRGQPDTGRRPEKALHELSPEEKV